MPYMIGNGCRSFDENNWARDLLSQVRTRSGVFTCQLSALVVGIGHRSVALGCLVYGSSGSQIQGAGAAIPAGYSQSRSFDDRSNSRPTYPTRAETSRHQCAQLAKVRLLRAQVGATVPRLCQIAHITKVPSAHPIATLGQPRIRSYVSRPICMRLTF
jgi:hypothetical protein